MRLLQSSLPKVQIDKIEHNLHTKAARLEKNYLNRHPFPSIFEGLPSHELFIILKKGWSNKSYACW